jgi:hypothetical protein
VRYDAVLSGNVTDVSEDLTASVLRAVEEGVALRNVKTYVTVFRPKD